MCLGVWYICDVVACTLRFPVVIMETPSAYLKGLISFASIGLLMDVFLISLLRDNHT